MMAKEKWTKGGGWVDKYGYVHIYDPNKKRTSHLYTLEHRAVMERHLERKLSTREHVHHKNGIRSDNRLENLEIIDISEHGRRHAVEFHASRTPEKAAEMMAKLWATRRANGNDGGLSGDANGHAKLSWDKVAEIRRLYSEGKVSQRFLAKKFGMCQGSIWQIVNNRQWIERATIHDSNR